MRNRRFSAVFGLLICFLAAFGQEKGWKPDVLAPDFQQLTVKQPHDYSGDVVSTVIRRVSAGCCPSRAILYVHGYNDYFFQREMAQTFNDSLWQFYAVDLRKYGRSIREGQLRYETRNLREYFPDIDSALSVMRGAGIRDVALMGHSTGGLITALFMAESAANPREAELKGMVKTLILNSPFLDWNFRGMMRHVVIPVVSVLGGVLPDVSFSQGDGQGYGESLLQRYHGEWSYNTDWKLMKSQPVTAGWIRAINTAQNYLTNHPYAVKVPVLLMHSSKAVEGSNWTEAYQHGDAVLNPHEIALRGRRLSRKLTDLTVPGGLHDLVLSAPPVRRAVYWSLFRFLNQQKSLVCRE